ncbi:hypothetical protein [Palaeococcus ferrophilus]|uniref:hypothetical protein n=1 Tax=Palaeococcus ferrophilus TaxID=83868 RepID=UPI0012F77C4B|nr:hypothetical protein [Palaeococcus ferrophilus]
MKNLGGVTMGNSRSLKIGALLLIFFVISINSEIVLATKSSMDEPTRGTEEYLNHVFKEYYDLKASGNESQARQLLESYGFKHLTHEEFPVKTIPGTPIQPMGGDQDDLHLSIDWDVYNDNGVAKLFVTYQWTWDHIEEFEGSPDKVSIAIPVGYWDGPTNSYPYHWLLEVSDRPYFISAGGVKSYEIHCESGYDDLAEDSNKLLHICRIYAEVYDHYNVGSITIGFSRINPEYYDYWIKTGLYISILGTLDLWLSIRFPWEDF